MLERLLAALATATLLPLAAEAQEPADLVLRRGKIVTVDDALGTVEALAARGGRIVAVGSDEEITPHIGEATRVLDLGGKLAIPGFIEGHGHFIGIGEFAQVLDLTKARTWDEIVDLCRAAAEQAAPGEWIVGRGWHQEKWDRPPQPQVEGFPTHEALSALTPEHPVSLTHASGHAAFFNHRAMELAGVDEHTRPPVGGEILLGADGRPCGVFRETAASLVDRVRTAALYRRSREQVKADLRRAVQLAAEDCLRHGVTSFQDAGTSFSTIDVLREFAEAGELPVRLWVMVRDQASRIERDLPRYRIDGAGGGFLTVRAVKLTIDGALGARGAWLLEPYADSADSTGLGRMDELERLARACAEHRFQFCVHGIGDRANREALDMFERILKPYEDRLARRWRIEHAQHLAAADIPRFGELGVIAAMQGIHCTSDAPYVIARLGEERAREGAYAWRSLLDTGAVIANGTDAPVESVDPIASFHASVTRETAAGWRFFPEQAMTREEALRSYTRDAAYAGFEEHLKGTLTPGKFADVVVLSEDILTVPDDRIRDAEVVYTIVGGRVVHQRP
jgi:predicted amidohydrolase YtcJ